MGFESEVTTGAVLQLRQMWESKTGQPLGRGWDAAFADWIGKFGLAVLRDAVQRAAVAGYSEDGERLPTNIRDVPRYAAVEQAEAREPGMRQCYFVRGRMRLKFYCDEHDDEVLELLRKAKQAGVTVSEMHQAVDEANTTEDCFAAIGIDATEFRIAMGYPIVDQPPVGKVFVREDEPEWRLWTDYLVRTRGRGSPMNRDFGWFFPSRLPPTEPPRAGYITAKLSR